MALEGKRKEILLERKNNQIFNFCKAVELEKLSDKSQNGNPINTSNKGFDLAIDSLSLNAAINNST